MKKISFYLQFIIILSFFVIPPLMVNESAGDISIGVFSPWTCASILVALVLYVEYKDVEDLYHLLREDGKKVNPLLRHIMRSGLFLSTLGLLCISQVIFNAIGMFMHYKPQEPSLHVTGAAGKMLCIFTMAAAAFFEEVIYRFYLPFALRKTAGVLKNRIVMVIFSEAAAALLFAFAHRYLGLLAVLNAFSCGILLRICALKSESLIPGFCAHFIYNLLTLLLVIGL